MLNTRKQIFEYFLLIFFTGWFFFVVGLHYKLRIIFGNLIFIEDALIGALLLHAIIRKLRKKKILVYLFFFSVIHFQFFVLFVNPGQNLSHWYYYFFPIVCVFGMIYVMYQWWTILLVRHRNMK